MIIIADRIKGITVEIGGDTTDLSRALKDVNSESRGLQAELRDVERLLKFDPGNVRLVAQQQEILSRQVETTSRKLQQLRDVEHQVQQQFERGDIGAEQLRRFQREIIQTEHNLQRLQNEMHDTAETGKRDFSKLGEGIAGAIGGAAAGMGIQEVVGKALETAHLNTQIEVGFNVPEESIGLIKETVGSIKAYGVEGETALEGVRKQFALNLTKSREQNAEIIKGAAAISQAYGDIDFNELIQESNEMAGSMEMSQEDALGMVNALLKMGFPPDQLDIITEYGAQLKRAGYDASEIQGIMAAGIDTKSWNIDKLLDGIKEGRIRLAEFGNGVDKTTAGLIKGTQISADELKKWGAAVAEGGDAGKVAMGEIALNLSKIEDPVKRNAIGVRLFGTMWEDTGKKITDTMLNSDKYAGDAAKNAAALRDVTKGIEADPQVQLNQALQDMNTALTPLLTMVADFVAKIASWVSQNPVLAATIVAITVGLGILTGLIIAAAGAISFLTGAAVALEIGVAPLIGIILAVIAVIAAIIAIGILLYKNWDTIKAKAVELGKVIASKFNEMKTAIANKMSEIWTKITSIWDKIVGFFKGKSLKQIGRDIIQGLIDGIGSMASAVWNKAKEIANGIGRSIKKALKIGSPSRLTMELGNFTGQGLIEGLHNTIGGIRNASQKMAAASIPKMGLPQQTTNNQTMNNQKSLVVNIQSPKALDVREANKEFRRTINRLSAYW